MKRTPGRRGAFAIVALLSVALAAACGAGGGSTPARPQAGRPVPPGDLLRIRRDLALTGRACARPRPTAQAKRAPAATRELVWFARRYPTQRFKLEGGGEDARMLSVLLVARSELGCAPRLVRAIDRALPATVRRAVAERAGG